jgi:hypothetical protein
MKKMTILVLAADILVKLVAAQTVFGFTAGATFSTYNVKIDGTSMGSKMKVGGSVGMLMSTNIGKNWWFLPGLNLTMKGGVIKNDASAITNDVYFGYLEIPLDIVYHTAAGKGQFFVGAGPSLNYGLFGKYKITGMYEESGNVKFGSGDDDDLKPFEIGANLLAGYKFPSGMLVSACYDLGLNNVAPVSDATFHNMYFGLRFGYFLPKK